jgi:hypothetical protein
MDMAKMLFVDNAFRILSHTATIDSLLAWGLIRERKEFYKLVYAGGLKPCLMENGKPYFFMDDCLKAILGHEAQPRQINVIF